MYSPSERVEHAISSRFLYKKKIVSNFKYKLVKKRWVLINFPLFCEVTNGFYCKRPNWRNCQHRKMTKFLQEI